MYVSPPNSRSTPGVFYEYFCNHARRARLGKLLYLELSRIPDGLLKCFWIQVAASLLSSPLPIIRAPGVDLELGELMHVCAHACMSVTLTKVRPLAHFIHIFITTPIGSALKNSFA